MEPELEPEEPELEPEVDQKWTRPKVDSKKYFEDTCRFQNFEKIGKLEGFWSPTFELPIFFFGKSLWTKQWKKQWNIFTSFRLFFQIFLSFFTKNTWKIHATTFTSLWFQLPNKNSNDYKSEWNLIENERILIQNERNLVENERNRA